MNVSNKQRRDDRRDTEKQETKRGKRVAEILFGKAKSLHKKTPANVSGNGVLVNIMPVNGESKQGKHDGRYTEKQFDETKEATGWQGKPKTLLSWARILREYHA